MTNYIVGSIKDGGLVAIIILLVTGLGLFAVNQALQFRYKSELLQTPCQLCASLNPLQKNCVASCFTYNTGYGDYPKLNISVGGDVNWSDNLKEKNR